MLGCKCDITRLHIPNQTIRTVNHASRCEISLAELVIHLAGYVVLLADLVVPSAECVVSLAG